MHFILDLLTHLERANQTSSAPFKQLESPSCVCHLLTVTHGVTGSVVKARNILFLTTTWSRPKTLGTLVLAVLNSKATDVLEVKRN